MIALPCRHRGGELSPGRFACNSSKLVVGARGVSLSLCAGCYCRDHGPEEAASLPRSVPCIYRSLESTGRRTCQGCQGHVEVKEFACAHPGHAAKPITTHRECLACPDYTQTQARRLILHNPLSPGDCSVMTAAVECLHRQHPGKFLTDVDSPCAAIFENNPWVTRLGSQGERLRMEYPSIHQSNQRAIHFMQAYVEFLGERLNVPLKLSVNRPYLYLSDEEKGWINQVEQHHDYKGKFWLVNAGTKRDFTTKGWGHANYQAVVDALKGRAQFVQVGEASHLHKPLAGVIDLIGQTDLRQLIRLAWHAEGAIGPSSLLQHLCAAWEKAYVCLLGGREPVTWVQYPKQTTLHTLGALDCCRNGACWKSRTVALGDGSEQDKSLCEQPDDDLPKCMTIIRPDDVIRAVERYL